MSLSETEFSSYLMNGVKELGLKLTPHQIHQFFFIYVNYKNGIAALILSAVMMTCP